MFHFLLLTEIIKIYSDFRNKNNFYKIKNDSVNNYEKEQQKRQIACNVTNREMNILNFSFYVNFFDFPIFYTLLCIIMMTYYLL